MKFYSHVDSSIVNKTFYFVNLHVQSRINSELIIIIIITRNDSILVVWWMD